MALYSIDQLQAKEEQELRQIAQELGTPNFKSGDKQTLVYDILDAQAEMRAADTSATPRRRQRITVKKETPAARPEASAKMVGGATDAQVEMPRRKRGRPSKAEIAAREAAAAQKQQAELALQTLFAEQSAQQTAAPENPEAEATSPAEQLPDFIEEQIAQHKAEEVEPAQSEATSTIQSETPALPAADEAPASPEKAQSKRKSTKPLIQTEKDFIIIRDIPAQPALPQYYADDMEGSMIQRPKFRRFKDDPLVQQNVVSLQPQAPKEEMVAPRAAVSEQPRKKERVVEVDEFVEGSGTLEIVQDGYGFLRSSDYNYLSSPDDIYVGAPLLRQYGLKAGDVVEGQVRVPRESDKFFVLTRVDAINGLSPEQARDRVAFEHLTPLFPDEKFTLWRGGSDSLSCRIVDLFAPIGKGQRALIVAQPKTGKTWLMKDIANAIARNHPEAYLMMLLIDERPEEVTDMARTVNAEVVASTFDEPAAHHVKIANIVLEKAKRMVESGHDVVIFLDSITRLARAYNTVSPASGKVLTGGVEANSLQYPKRFFGAARNIEGGGSLTIIATALIDTGSKMDEVIFEEFKGTGNMELQLERSLANKRIYPAVNLVLSSTRRDDLLQSEGTRNLMIHVRKHIADMTPVEAMNFVTTLLARARNNEEMLSAINS
ncbi:MAG: transcription termination factor Rho [Alloprevotella sp.]|nr:transcription termination factor Rho [Alloprevotella sp.]